MRSGDIVGADTSDAENVTVGKRNVQVTNTVETGHEGGINDIWRAVQRLEFKLDTICNEQSRLLQQDSAFANQLTLMAQQVSQLMTQMTQLVSQIAQVTQTTLNNDREIYALKQALQRSPQPLRVVDLIMPVLMAIVLLAMSGIAWWNGLR